LAFYPGWANAMNAIPAAGNSPCDSDFAAELFSHYSDRSYGEFADRLFGDEEAEPSDDFILAFARAAVGALEEIERRKLTDWVPTS
jgi:hypothetical protein